MGSLLMAHWIVVGIVFLVLLPILLIALIVFLAKGEENEIADTWKFRTFVFIILALIIPFWVVTLPLFLYLAYRSYKAGKPVGGISATASPLESAASAPFPFSKAQEIAELHKLLEQGALTQREYDHEKQKILTREEG